MNRSVSIMSPTTLLATGLAACLLGAAANGEGDLDVIATTKLSAISGAMVVGLEEFVLHSPFDVDGFDTPLDHSDSLTQGGATIGGRAVCTTTAIPTGFKVMIEATGFTEINDCDTCLFAFGQSDVGAIVGFELTRATRVRMTGAGIPGPGQVQIRLETETELWLNEICNSENGECPAGRIDVMFDEVLPPGQYGLTLAAEAIAGLECLPPCQNGMFDALTTWNLCVETEAAPSECPADADGNDEVGFSDVLLVLANWGCRPSEGNCADPNADVDGDDEIGFGDILTILGTWGPCP